MLTGNNTNTRRVKLSNQEMQRVTDFLQGAVNCWCNDNSHKGKWFIARDIVGGDWTSTPLMILHTRQRAKGKTYKEANEQAGKDFGTILKEVLAKDRRNFDTEDGYPRKYRWI